MRRCVLPAPARITRPIKMAGIVDSDTQKKKSGTELHGNWRHCAKGALCSVPEASTTLPARSSEARWWRQCCPGAQTASFPDKYPKILFTNASFETQTMACCSSALELFIVINKGLDFFSQLVNLAGVDVVALVVELQKFLCQFLGLLFERSLQRRREQ